MTWLHPSLVWLVGIVPVVAGLYAYARRQRSRAWERLGDPGFLQQMTAVARPRRRLVKAGLPLTGNAPVVGSLPAVSYTHFPAPATGRNLVLPPLL